MPSVLHCHSPIYPCSKWMRKMACRWSRTFFNSLCATINQIHLLCFATHKYATKDSRSSWTHVLHYASSKQFWLNINPNCHLHDETYHWIISRDHVHFPDRKWHRCKWNYYGFRCTRSYKQPWWEILWIIKKSIKR